MGSEGRLSKDERSEEENSDWMPFHDLIQGLDNQLFLQHIYSRLSPRDRAITACLNKDWAEVHFHLNKYTKFADFVILGRKLSNLPQVPSLIAFIQGINRFPRAPRPNPYGWFSTEQLIAFNHWGNIPSGHPETYPSWWFSTEQFFFHENDRHISGRIQENGFSGSPPDPYQCSWPNMASPINHYIIRAVGSNVIAIENMIDKETEAYEGHLECSKLWRWIRTASCPPPRPSEISHGWGTLLHVLVVGGLLIKFITEKEIRCLAHGSYYDPHSKQWSRLTSLYQPVHRRRRIIPITPFQYHNKLFFSGQLFGYFQYVCSYYNFETHTWSPWNATPELILLANAVGKFGRKRWVQEDEDDRVLFVEAADGTLFVVERNFCYHNSAYFLSIDESAAEGFEWIELDLAPMHGYTFEKKKYINTQAWPLQDNGGIVIVSEPILQPGEVEWCFLNKSGVYATGTVHRCNVRGFNRAQYMQYMHDVYWIDPFEEDSVHSFNRTDYALIYTHI